MKHEKSCGAVLYRMEGGERRYLLLHSTQGHFTLCKGHVEGAESEEETAHREILEETALRCRLLPGFRQVISYAPRPGVWKEVVFFLGELLPGKPQPQPEEVLRILLLPCNAALAQLTHSSDKEVLAAAERFLNTER